MPNSIQNSKINAAFYHSLGKVLTESSNLVGNEKYKSAHNVRSNEVWMDSISYAPTTASASQYGDGVIVRQVGSASAIPDSIGIFSSPVYLYPLTNTNYQTWFIDTGTPTPAADGFVPSIDWVKSLINPSDVPDNSGAPSFGYQLLMYQKDGTTAISYGSAYYDVDYFSGLIRFDIGYTPTDSGNGLGFTFNKVNFEATPNISKQAYIQNTSTGGPRVIAWQYVGQRLNNYTFSSSGSGGSAGTSGTSGSSGTSGTSGTSGSSGTSGTSGSSGTSGTSGSSGTSGTSGVSGSNGTSGTSGSSGTSGTSGSSGTSGTSGVSGSPAGVITDPNSGISISYGSTNSTIDTAYNTALDPSLSMPNTVGGIASGTTAGSLSSLNLVQLFDDLLFPTVTPTYTIPTIGLASTITGIKEVGETISPAITLTGTENDANYFSQLVIQKSVNSGSLSTLLTVSATSSMTITSASAIASQFGYADPNNPNFSYAISTTDSGLVVPAPASGGSSTVAYSGLGDYTAGLAKKNNKGVTHSATPAVRSTLLPQASGSNFASNVQTITGYYPYFYGKTPEIEGVKSASDIVTIIQSGTGFTKVVNAGSGSLSMAFSAVNEYPWFAVYSVYPTKSTWFESSLNSGGIGGGVAPNLDLFAAPTTLSVISSDGYWTVTYKIYPANKVTTLGTATIA
jgi:hypothetical protein